MLYLDHWQGDEESPEPAGSTIRTIMAVPLMGLVGECLGVIQLDTHLVENALDEEDLERLVVMSNVVAAALEQARETEHAIAEAVPQNAAWLMPTVCARNSPRVGRRRFPGIVWPVICSPCRKWPATLSTLWNCHRAAWRAC